ncbi:hypothetical protein TNCV_3060021 [Trichonephila clavipes]|nr:hypothetical protein TNCV_3060021 [Trichonephila clavipes]
MALSDSLPQIYLGVQGETQRVSPVTASLLSINDSSCDEHSSNKHIHYNKRRSIIEDKAKETKRKSFQSPNYLYEAAKGNLGSAWPPRMEAMIDGFVCDIVR